MDIVQEITKNITLFTLIGMAMVLAVALVILLIIKRALHKLGPSSGPLYGISHFTVWSLAFLLIISNLGYDITSLITGLGVGGIAVALAAQETLSNAFGSLSLLSDKVFRVGDQIKIDHYRGTVIKIGLRSTKIRTDKGTFVLIPNKMMAANPVENLSTVAPSKK